ncbi:MULTISPECIES: bifunctional protein-serine/threonine kinase/phosphatase [unclassified Bradyrhizobium]|uniref:bifunctional protein-serine/threonine kinase/phosphatase n=1 Tax=Bradyrhizobium TaxID=374 RepID=UPI0028E1CDAB|nr:MULTISPECIES: protein phosphatase 2C domain-containing protein [unclassified Bradyrhizobium]
MAGAHRNLQVRVGFASETGKRPNNEDYVGARLGLQGATDRDIVAAVADGVGGHKGGREAAELAVRGFIDAYHSLPETAGVRSRAARALEAINSWIHAQGRVDPELHGMSCAFSAVVLSRRTCHVVHVGDTRVYRLSEGRLERLTTDHVAGRADLAHVLNRGIGFEQFARFDYTTLGMRQHDRFLICSDGIHGILPDSRLQEILAERTPPDDSARGIVAAALAAGSNDNSTALVLDVVDLPPADRDELTGSISSLPIGELPSPGDVIDGFRLGELLSDGRYSRLFKAIDAGQGDREVVLKFPHPRVASEGSFRLAFIREAWVAARVRSIWIGEIIELPVERQTRLYSAMPFYAGETLEQRLNRPPRLSLAEGTAIATKLVRAVVALHRAGIIHRDIKPDNVILLENGGLRLIDLGVARVPRFEDFPAEDIPGTPSYMAPELFAGKPGDEASDLFALGVTVYRMFTRSYPFGEIEPFSRPRFGKPVPISRYRPELPAWLDAVIGKALNVDPAQRYGDAIEFAHELENGASWAGPAIAKRRSLHDRNPLLFWRMLCALQFIIIIILLSLLTRH